MNKHYDVFVSYSRKDYVDENKNIIPGNVVSTLKNILNENQISYWFDEDGIYSGDTFAEKIASNIEKASVLLFISSENSNVSKWTSKEIAAASMWKKKIIPVRIDHSPYNRTVMLYIADLDYVDYMANPEKAKEVIIESIKNQIEKEKQEKKAEELAREEHRQQQEYIYREITERIVRYNTEQKILQTSYFAIHKDIERLEDAEKRQELRQMFDKNHSIIGDNDEMETLRKRNRLLETEIEKLRVELSLIRTQSYIYNNIEEEVVNIGSGMKNAFNMLCKVPLGYWFTFHGTVNRCVYAIAIFFISVIILIPLLLLAMGFPQQLVVLVWLFILLAAFVSALSFGVRRCRDVGKKWYWLLIPYYFVILLFEKRKC